MKPCLPLTRRVLMPQNLLPGQFHFGVFCDAAGRRGGGGDGGVREKFARGTAVLIPSQ